MTHQFRLYSDPNRTADDLRGSKDSYVLRVKPISVSLSGILVAAFIT
jgi:hypothetical protein